jgi:hypothetical protein
MGKPRFRRVFAGADSSTPSRAQYFSWINNTNEGATESQTQANLEFFRYLHDAYGMVLDIYALDAGAIDGAGFYGSMDSQRFARQFPRGFGPLVGQAALVGCRLGLWGGPDGFGQTPADAQRRIEMMVSLCRDHQFSLFKMDAVCGGLRKSKRAHFVRMMSLCRQHSPDLILLNHRLDLGPQGLKHATTFLWEGAETYIDVHMANATTATHNRVCAMSRGNVPRLQRLTEDHGVCLSSCLDYWEDELIIQAFGRCLILSPEIYGNPWLLRDDELPRLARIYNLHRHYRHILVSGMLLPERRFGPSAVSRGDRSTRLITLRNLTWEPVEYAVPLDSSIGLRASRKPVHVRRFHPHERIIGEFAFGQTVPIRVEPFRSCLILVSTEPVDQPGVSGCDYDVIRDVPGRDLVIRLLGEPGTIARVSVSAPGHRPESRTVRFSGRRQRLPHHRKLGDLVEIPVPADVRGLYEATCFAADANALEVRELLRSGPTAIGAVQRARDAFFSQPTFRRRDLWDQNLFDDDPTTAFAVGRRWGDGRVRGGCFRLDLGKPTLIDQLTLEVGCDHDLQPLKPQEAAWGSVSADLRTWSDVRFFISSNIDAQIPGGKPIRYIVLNTPPDRIRHVRGWHRGQVLNRTGWRASNLLGGHWMSPVGKTFAAKFRLSEALPGSYLAIAINGVHGVEKAYAALRVGRGYAGAPRRAPSYPSNSWECPVRQVDRNYTYFIPVTPDMLNKPLEAVVMLVSERRRPWSPPEPIADVDLKCEVWLTAYPTPYAKHDLALARRATIGQATPATPPAAR